MRNSESGFIGVLILLLGSLLIIFFILRTDIFSNKSKDGNMIQNGVEAIDKAKGVRTQIEIKSQEVSKQ